MSAIDDIRARHARQESVNAAWSPNQIPQAHHDRGALLRVVDDQAAEIAEKDIRIQKLLDACNRNFATIERRGKWIAERDAEITRLREALDHAKAFFAEAGYLATLAHVRDIARGPVEANQEEAQHGE